jgi:NAD(P) transhydrogenase subunit alpha
MAIAAVVFLGITALSKGTFLAPFTVFALAVVIGFYVIGNVAHALHTPLMSVTNAISGIIIVGALLQLGASGTASTGAVAVLAFVGTLVASINIFGGFTVTRRMLTMFRKG